jgi:plasmid stabilization system protein ParE
MALPYQLHEKAYHEYIEAYEWYERKQEGLGNRFMNNVEKRIQQISEHPYYYSNKHGNYREAKVEDFPYLIVYEVFKQKQLIHIAAIYHGKRNPKSKYRRFKK